MKRVIIIGGGIAGLAAAHRIVELNDEQFLGVEVVLLEGSHRLGGSIATERVGDFLIEAGPDSFISEKPWALRLCERLGLTPRLVSTQAAYQKIYIVHRGKLEALPEGFFLLAPTRFWPFVQTPLFSWRGKLRIAGELFLPRAQANHNDESLGSFVRRRFGREALERVAQPLVGGIYAADPEQLSLAATMPRFLEMERNRRSVIRSMWSDQRRRARRREAGSGARWSLFVTLADGMQELVDAVAGRLPANSIRYDAPASALSQNPATQKWHVQTKAGDSFDADAVIVAAPALHAAPLLRAVADVATMSWAKSAMLPPPRSASPIGATIFRARRTAFGFRRPRDRKKKNHGVHIQQLEVSRARAGRSSLIARLRRRRFAAGTFPSRRRHDGAKCSGRIGELNGRHRQTDFVAYLAPSELNAPISHRPRCPH